MEKGKKQSEFVQKCKRVFGKIKAVTDVIEKVIGKIGNAIIYMRKVLLTIPVVLLAMKVFVYAREELPQDVGLILQESGNFKYMLDRDSAIIVCAAITGACLLLMYLSRRTIYPWIISIFSLVLPLFLIVSNIFPA